jgi:hypothetical protein
VRAIEPTLRAMVPFCRQPPPCVAGLAPAPKQRQQETEEGSGRRAIPAAFLSDFDSEEEGEREEEGEEEGEEDDDDDDIEFDDLADLEAPHEAGVLPGEEQPEPLVAPPRCVAARREQSSARAGHPLSVCRRTLCLEICVCVWGGGRPAVPPSRLA